MIALSVSDISLSFGTDVILKDISFAINEGDRLGIIGVNGAGKTSLFKLIGAEYRPDTGSIFIGQGLNIGILEQNPDLSSLPKDLTSLEYMYTAFPSLIRLEELMGECEASIARAEREGDEGELLRLSGVLAELNRKFTNEGGLEFRARAKGMLIRLGFTEDMINRKISTLSGGQYTKLSLARLLATEPDILMLDEPTNHLDIDALLWLESFISSYKKTVVIISHDRYFLDKTTNKTLWLRHGGARLYPAPFTRAHELASAEEAQLEHRYREQQKEIAKIRANIEFQRRCNREHNFVTIRSKEKQIARMEKIELSPRPQRDIYVSFNAEEDSANDVLSVKNLSFGYGDKALIKNLSFLVRRGERVMFLGPNGCGKSTLMKLINSRLTPNEGSLTLGYNVKIGYYDQENRGLSDTKTVFLELHDEYPEKTNLEIRSALALFRFCGEDVDKSVSTLSGGERARLTLAKLILKKVNLLILDEPTNHLDTGSAEALEVALVSFPGTIISVSHDRYFINRIATRIIELCPDAPSGMIDVTLNEDDDAFGYYIKMRDMIKERLSTDKPEPIVVTSAKLDYEEKKRENAKRRAEEKKIERAKAKIAELEEELTRLDEELFGAAATDYMRASEIDIRKGEIEEELLSLYELVM